MPFRFSDIEVIGDLTRSGLVEQSGTKVDCSGFRSERRRRRTVRTDKSERGCREEQGHGHAARRRCEVEGWLFLFLISGSFIFV